MFLKEPKSFRDLQNWSHMIFLPEFEKSQSEFIGSDGAGMAEDIAVFTASTFLTQYIITAIPAFGGNSSDPN